MCSELLSSAVMAFQELKIGTLSVESKDIDEAFVFSLINEHKKFLAKRVCFYRDLP